MRVRRRSDHLVPRGRDSPERHVERSSVDGLCSDHEIP